MPFRKLENTMLRSYSLKTSPADFFFHLQKQSVHHRYLIWSGDMRENIKAKKAYRDNKVIIWVQK